MRPSWYERRDYDTRLDRFRVAEGIAISTWVRKAKIKRSQFNRYRAGTEPRIRVAARLVKAASDILSRPVRMAELWDVGEDVPVSELHAGGSAGLPRVVTKFPPLEDDYSDAGDEGRRSKFAALVHGIGLPPAAFAELVGISRPEVLRIIAGANLHLRTLRQIVSALRRAGHHVTAADIVDDGSVK